MKPFFLSLLGLSLSFTLQANDYENAEKELVEKNKSALSKLAETRTKIQNEKIPLATDKINILWEQNSFDQPNLAPWFKNKENHKKYDWYE